MSEDNSNTKTKICSTCKIEKFHSEFNKNKGCWDGVNNCCKVCHNIYNKKYYDKTLSYQKERKRIYNSINKEKNSIREKEYRLNNKEKRKEYESKNRKKFNAKKLVYIKKRKLTDINYKLKLNLRSRFHSAILKQTKSGSAVKNLGCSIQHLKLHLELFFDEGMSWDNWGKGNDKWNIDHIKPLGSFDLSKREQVLEACNFLNLQPLWEQDNIFKADKIIVN